MFVGCAVNRVLVVVRTSRHAKVFPVEMVMGKGGVSTGDPMESVGRWVSEACARTSNDLVCRSLSVEVHVDGADCDHEVGP